MKFRITLITIFLSILNFITNAQPISPGQNDPTFNAAGSGTDRGIWSIVKQPDGKILIAGYLTTYNGVAANGLARLNPDGSLDNAFQNNVGAGIQPSFINYIRKVTLQPDGKILIAGTFSTYKGVSRSGIARLNADGTLDNTFNIGTGINTNTNTIYTVLVQPDGKIIIGGNFTAFNGIPKNRIARLNADGTLDNTFLTNANNSVYTISLYGTNKILIGGAFNTINGTNRTGIARLNTDGILDNTFAIGTGTDEEVFGINQLPNGKIIMVGDFRKINNIAQRGIARLNADGSLDNTFAAGVGTNAYAAGFVVDQNEKIILFGGFDSYNGTFIRNIVRLNTNGSIDNTFTPTFNVNPSANVRAIFTVEFQDTTAILIGGLFENYNGTSKNHLVRLASVLSTSIENNESKNSLFLMYPNPATGGQITIQLKDQTLDKASISIIDLLGKTIAQHHNISTNTNTAFNLDVSALNNGIYITKIVTDKGTFNQKLYIQK